MMGILTFWAFYACVGERGLLVAVLWNKVNYLIVWKLFDSGYPTCKGFWHRESPESFDEMDIKALLLHLSPPHRLSNNRTS